MNDETGPASSRRSNCWRLSGWDTFAHESYPIGDFPDEASAREAAKKRLKKYAQSRHRTGGPPPGGIEDLIFVVRPDGSSYIYSD